MQISGFQLHEITSVRLIAQPTRTGHYLAVEITDADGQSLVLACHPAQGRLIPDVHIDEARAEFPEPSERDFAAEHDAIWGRKS